MLRDIEFRGKLTSIGEWALENGVVVLPCKVGDTVYHYCKALDMIFPYFVESLHFFYDDSLLGYYCTIEANYSSPLELVDCIDFDLSDIGKTVFLTEKEAEQALERSKTNDKF